MNQKLFQIGPLTRFYLGNGTKSARTITRKLLDRHDFESCFERQPFFSLYENVVGIVLVLAEYRKGFVKLRTNPSDAIFYPLVSRSEIVNLGRIEGPNLRPKVGKRVRFSLWHGNTSPHILEWTGEIIQIRRESGLPMYQILRDYDHEIIELRKAFLYSYA